MIRIAPIAFLVIIIPCATPLFFNFSSFITNDPTIINYQQSAYAADGVIYLTPDRSGVIGRATYAQPLQLWDRASGNLTDFTTEFSFVIDSQNRSTYSDGLAFFLAAARIPPGNVTELRSLGLTNDSQTSNSIQNPFVAVEFDTWSNDFDPPYNHVGIDVNSLTSVATAVWWSNISIMEGRRNQASISYDSSSNNLAVTYTAFRNGAYVNQSISHVVDLRRTLPELVYFGFSGGSGYNSPALHNIMSWNFYSTVRSNRTNSGAVPSSPPALENSKNRNLGLTIGLAVGGPSLVLGLGLSMYFFWKNRKWVITEVNETFEVPLSDEFERGSGPRKFSYCELAQATSNFREQEKLGEGGFGGVYKGFLKKINSYVAVKRVSRGSNQGIKEYASEVKIISRLRHRNLVQLLGWCHEKQELLLVYEFMPNGSLDTHLFKGRSLLNWGMRFKIVQGLASALLYLHEEWEQCVVHRDIKSSNIMLDANFNTKLGDFGLARLVDHEKGSKTTDCAGTRGYMAPECHDMSKASKESDVFSFGVVVLEICCGRRPIDNTAEDCRVVLVEWVWGLYGMGRILDAADPLLDTEFNAHEMEQLMIVALSCAHPDSNLRPSIAQVVIALSKFETPLSAPPLSMPVPTYFTPPTDIGSPSHPLLVVHTGNTMPSKSTADSF